MNRKKYYVFAIAVVMLFSITSVAYAWTLSGISSISTGIITVKGTSTTSSTVTCDSMFVECAIYRDGININFSQKEAAGVKSLSATTGGGNLPGEQYWEVHGLHTAEAENDDQMKTSYASTWY